MAFACAFDTGLIFAGGGDSGGIANAFATAFASAFAFAPGAAGGGGAPGGPPLLAAVADSSGPLGPAALSKNGNKLRHLNPGPGGSSGGGPPGPPDNMS